MNLKIDNFEGPLDLLLHLIKENKMDIFDIQVEKITEQYLQFIQQLEDKNLEIASSYLVMASELIELKARMLLPKPVVTEEEQREDPRDELVTRLLEYQAYKAISDELKKKEKMRQEIYTKLPTNRKEYQPNEPSAISQGDTLDHLLDAFQKFLLRKQEEQPLQTKVTMKEITVSSRKLEIREKLKKEKRVRFFDLFPILSTEYLVATFLAILEMARNQELIIQQDRLFAEIFCEVN